MEEQQKTATQVTGCNKCKKGMSNTQWALLIFSLYMFGAGVYGTIQIVKDIVSLF